MRIVKTYELRLDGDEQFTIAANHLENGRGRIDRVWISDSQVLATTLYCHGQRVLANGRVGKSRFLRAVDLETSSRDLVPAEVLEALHHAGAPVPGFARS